MTALAKVDSDSLKSIANIISSRKYSYDYDYSLNDSLLQLAQRIFGDKSVLLFEPVERKVADELDNAFSDYLSHISRDYFKHRKVDDELDLIKASYELERGFFSLNNVDESSGYEGSDLVAEAKSSAAFFKNFPLSRSTVKGYVAESEFLNRVDSNTVSGLSLFFVTKRIEHAGQQKILLSILSQRPHSIGSFHLIFSFLFSYKEFGDMLGKPTRLFLKILDYYGYDVTIGSESKRFWGHKYVRSLAELPKEVEIGKATNWDTGLIFFFGKKGSFADQIAFLFVINYKQYFADLKADII